MNRSTIVIVSESKRPKSAVERGLAIARSVLKAIGSSFALYAVVSTVVSCGGSGVQAPSPFQGKFAGNWTSNGPHSGTAVVTLTPGGVFTGSEVDTTNNAQGSVNGALQTNGTFTGTVQPQGRNPIDASGLFQIGQNGTMLNGTLTYGGVNYTFTLTRQ